MRVEMFDRGNAPAGAGPVTDNFWTQWIQENFGDPNNIKMEFVPVPRNQEVDKLNVLIATGDAPDIVFTYSNNTVYSYAKDGGLTDLGPIIDEYGSNLKEFLGEEVLKYGIINGVQYTILAKRPLQHMQASYIRKDWLDKLGLPVPTTTEQFYDTLKAFKEKDPGQVGSKLIPYDFSEIYSSAIASPATLISSFNDSVSEEDFYALSPALNTPELMRPGYKEGVRFVNQLNAEGLINSNFALDKDGKKFESDVANGYVGAFTALAAHPSLLGTGQVFDTLKQNVPGAEYVAMDPFTDKEGKTPKMMYDPIGMHIMIPKSSKHAAEAVKYLDWMAQQDILFTLQNGIEGQHYTLENGYPKAITTDEAKKTFYNNQDIAIISNGKDFGSLEKNIEAAGYQFPGYEEIAMQPIRYALKDGYTYPYFNRPIDSEIKYGTTLISKATETVVKSIVASRDQFNSIYDAGVNEYLKLGGQAVMDERRAAYQDMHK
ncbi:extracellular solute-binding protein [Paenibacillus jiagnxiensis]|uniref:extracellular solute-binding protein n=1 Tax=Paenibacillus jiagnxiensis TaxID=3228926 RepID=UPI0033BADDDD